MGQNTNGAVREFARRLRGRKGDRYILPEPPESCFAQNVAVANGIDLGPLARGGRGRFSAHEVGVSVVAQGGSPDNYTRFRAGWWPEEAFSFCGLA